MKTKYFVVTNCDDNEVINVVGIVAAKTPDELVENLRVAAADHFDDTDLELMEFDSVGMFSGALRFPVPFYIGHYFSGILDVTLSQIF